MPPDTAANLILPLELPAQSSAQSSAQSNHGIRIRGRFLRSVHLERDFYTPGATEGYVPTPAAYGALSRILPGAMGKPAARAFSITGPYGSGKSAFALTLVKALAAAPVGDADLRREAQKAASQPLFEGETESGLWPVLIVGGRQPLMEALVEGLSRTWKRLPVPNIPLPDKPPRLTGASVAGWYEAAAARLREAVPGVRGLIVVIDEAGKFLEFAALHESAGDMQVLQELAEAAVRSAPDAPLMVVTILHQAFDEYAQKLGPTTRNEWRKVQGRFTDLAFADAPEEMLRLVARAMERAPDASCDTVIYAAAHDSAKRAFALGLLPRGMGENEFAELCASAFPLHPITLLALPYVFRRFGQGERSLFGFLSGDEPNGLKDFLTDEAASDRTMAKYYSLDRLYDYLLSNVGASALIGGGAGSGPQSATARLWSETQEAVERSGEQEALPPLAAPTAKIIGLLHVLGADTALRLPASAEVIAFALDAVPVAEVDAALAGLTRATLIMYRRYKNAFRPYEGSDLDVEERLRDVLSRMNRSGTTVDISATAVKLHNLVSSSDDETSTPLLLPLVARRHLFETGTLRVFEVVLVQAEALLGTAPPLSREREIVPRTGTSVFDGTLLLALTSRDAQRAEDAGEQVGTLFARHPEYIVGVLRETLPLQEAARTLDALLTLQNETPELARDRVAAREVRERIVEAEAAFRGEWERLLAGKAGENDAAAVKWFWQGRPVSAQTPRDRQKLVSDACQAAYPHTPRLLNELVNRRVLTSAAASARRLLFEAMIERHEEDTLGITGFPPERSMYAAVLRETGIHRFNETSEVWEFGPPTPGRDPALSRIWETIEAFLFGSNDRAEDEAESGEEGEEETPIAADITAKPLMRIWERLRHAPFGLGDGVIPVLLCAAFLHHASEVVLYEEGAFVIGLDAATFERMAKRPEMFTVQGVRLTGERALVLERLGQLLKPDEAATVGNIARGLYRRVARLPAFALRTEVITPPAARVRALLKEAREPERLLFVELPQAVGADALGDQADPDGANIERFFAGLNGALQSWFGAYPALLSRLEAQTFRAFDVEDADGLRARVALVQSGVREPRLGAFVTHVLEAGTAGGTGGGAVKWIEPVASVVVGRSPLGWTDADAARYADALMPLVTALQSAELVAFARAKENGTEDTVGVRFAPFIK